MSIRALNWAFAQDVPTTVKCLLLTLADHSDDFGRSWPSVDRLAARTSATPRSVRRWLADLRKAGLVEIEHRRGRSSLYTLRISDLSTTPDTVSSPTPNISPSTPDIECTKPLPNRSSRTINESSRNQEGGGSRLALKEIPPTWKTWARKERPDIEVDSVWVRFVDYHRSLPGSQGVRSDWAATWRNWVRRERKEPTAPMAASHRPFKPEGPVKIGDRVKALAEISRMRQQTR